MAIHWSPPPRDRLDPKEQRRQRLAGGRLPILRERGVSEKLLSVVFGQRDPVVDALIEDWGLGAVEWMDDLDHDPPQAIGLASFDTGHHGVFVAGRDLRLVEDRLVRPVSELEVWQDLFRLGLELSDGTPRDAAGRPLDRVVVRARLFELGGSALSTWAATYLG